MEIKKLIEKRLPFSVLVYRHHLRTVPGEQQTVLELIYLDALGGVNKRIIERKEIQEHWRELNQVVKGPHGSVYDFNDFKRRAQAIHGEEGLKKELK